MVFTICILCVEFNFKCSTARYRSRRANVVCICIYYVMLVSKKKAECEGLWKMNASTRALRSKDRHFGECVDGGGLLDIVDVGFGYCGLVVAVAE